MIRQTDMSKTRSSVTVPIKQSSTVDLLQRPDVYSAFDKALKGAPFTKNQSRGTIARNKLDDVLVHGWVCIIAGCIGFALAAAALWWALERIPVSKHPARAAACCLDAFALSVFLRLIVQSSAKSAAAIKLSGYRALLLQSSHCPANTSTPDVATEIKYNSRRKKVPSTRV